MESYLIFIQTFLRQTSYNTKTIDDLIIELTEFENKLKSMNPIDLGKFEHDNMKLLGSIYFELDYLAKDKSRTDKTNGTLLSHKRDILFRSILRNVKIETDKYVTTRIFNNFIRGITFFNKEKVYDTRQPVYHRKGSCSKKGTPNTKCLNQNSKADTKTKANEIRKCFIERLVYDEIWTQIVHSSQDLQHLQWLEDTRKSYISCFPNSSISIDIQYDEYNTPVKCEISNYK